MGLCASASAALPARSYPDEYVSIVHSCPIFSGVPEGDKLEHFARHFELKSYEPGAYVGRTGEIDPTVYVVVEGSAVVHLGKSEQDDYEELTVIEKNGYFGEISLVKRNTVRSANVRAGEQGLSTLVLSHFRWKKLADQSWYPRVNRRLQLAANHRFSSHLKTVNFLSKVPESSLDVLGGLFRLVFAEPNTVVLREGAPGRGFFIVSSGAVTISSTAKDGELSTELETITSDSKRPYFGELSLIERIPVTATVVAKSECLLLHLSAEAFLNFLGIVPDSVKQSLRDGIKGRALRALSHMVTDVIDPTNVGLTSELKTADEQ